jgi:quercetin dioxygenase-like cupin family protein
VRVQRGYDPAMPSVHVPRPDDLARAVITVPHEATGGAVSFVEQSMAPRHLIPCHVHERTDVWIYVVDGLVGVRVGDDEATGASGDYLLKPRGVPHAMWNPGDAPNRLIEILTPGNGDEFFRDMLAMQDDAPRDVFEEICARHGIRWLERWTAELCERYGLSES